MIKLKDNLKATLVNREGGFITMIMCLILLLVIVIGFVYMRVARANN